MKKRKTLLIVCACTMLITMIMLSGCALINDTINSSTSAPGQTVGKHDIDINNIENPSIGEIVANNCIEGVVMITAATNGFATVASLGSGFFVNEQGYIVTNSHVVHGKDVFQIETIERTIDGESVISYKQNARLIAEDPKKDLAILKLGTDRTVNYLTFESEDSVAYGQTCFTIGNPNGLEFTMSQLMIANPKLLINDKDAYKHIVLDGNVNHGNSGGALISADSKVIGVIDARIEGNSSSKNDIDVFGVGLAIPNDVVKSFLREHRVKFYTDKDEIAPGQNEKV